MWWFRLDSLTHRLDFWDFQTLRKHGENFGCITEIEFSSDGSLYVISYLNNGAIYKIQPK